jgi:NTP pyrophosphatase (non-canonical NTP hydrolase)
MITENSSLEVFQQHNAEIYSAVNDRAYGRTEMFFRLLSHTTHILKATRKKNHKNTTYEICMALSWLFALANRYRVDLAKEMWNYFPGCCPYCLATTCTCLPERPRFRQKLDVPKRKRPSSLREWQQMFSKLYPNVIESSASHLAEEVGEVAIAIMACIGTHKQETFRQLELELVDVLTNIFAVANCLNIDIANAFIGYFGKGCPACHQPQCACGFVTDDEPIQLLIT